MQLQTAIEILNFTPETNYLLWLSERLYLRTYGKRLFSHNYIATEKGIECDVNLSEITFSNISATEEELGILQNVKERFGIFSFSGLQIMSKDFPEYLNAKNGRVNILDFFENPNDKILSPPIFKQPENFLKLKKEEYLTSQNICKS